MKEKKLFWIIVFNGIIIFSEILFGVVSNSFALIADALHNIGDVLALFITLIALKLGKKITTFRYTFGFIRAEMMAAFVNTLFLFLTMIYMVYEAVSRFFHPQIIEPLYMIVVGFIALIANGISAYVLSNIGVSSCTSNTHSHTHHEDTNIKSAYLHMLSDALISLGVVIGGFFIYYFKVYYLDSILTIVFSFYILWHSYPLLKKSFLSLMDVNITDIDKKELENIIKRDKNIIEYHDLHIYKPSSKHNFISFHVVLNDANTTLKECEEMVNGIKSDLKDKGFSHILIQTDTKECIKNQTNCDINKE